jgi:hypothetical protein
LLRPAPSCAFSFCDVGLRRPLISGGGLGGCAPAMATWGLMLGYWRDIWGGKEAGCRWISGACWLVSA